MTCPDSTRPLCGRLSRLAGILLLATVWSWSAPAARAKRRPGPRPKVTYPKLIKFVRAVYPEAARQAGRQGVVYLHVTVSAKGTVLKVTVFRSAGKDLDQAAAAAVRQFVYKPATVDGRPIAAKISVAYPFRLRQTPPTAPRPQTDKGRPATRPKTLPRAAPPRRKTAPRRPPTRPPAKTRRRVTRPKPAATSSSAVLSRIAGRIREKGTRSNLEDAEVLVYRPAVGSTARRPRKGKLVASTYSEKGGRFLLKDLSPGTYLVEVRAPGSYVFRVLERVSAGTRLMVEYFVERRSYDPYETVVTARAERKEVSRYQVALPEIQKIPGTQGDALRAIQNMPGVARASFGAGALVVRGAAPGDTRVFLEGHEIPQLYHFFGLTSVFNSDILREIVFVPGNFSVQYGRATGGIIDVYTRKAKKDRWHGYLDVDLWDIGLLVEGPVGKGSIAISARRSHIDAVLGVLPKDLLGVNLTLAPAYYDYQVMLDYPVLGGNLKALVFGSDDRVKVLFDEPRNFDPTAREISNVVMFHRALLLWGRRWDKNELKMSVSSGYQEIDVTAGSALKFNLKTARTNWRLHYARRFFKNLTVAIGLDGEYSYAWVDFVLPRATPEGEVPAPLASQERVASRVSSGLYTQALYLEGTWKPVRWLTLIPGLRGGFLSVGPFHGYYFDPRLTAKFDLAKKVALTAAVGLFHQEPFFTDIYEIVGGNPDVSHERTLHASTGVAWKIRQGLSLEVTGFYKHLWRRVSGSDEIIYRDGQAVPERVTNHGLGRIYGGELLLKKKPDRDCPSWLKLQKCFGWISYTLLRSERLDGPGERWRLFDFDQTHILTVILSGTWPGGWGAGLRFRLASGNPATVLQGGVYDADADLYIGLPGQINGERLPLFHQLDLRVDKKFVFKKWILSIYLDIQNVYNYRASEFVRYNFNYTQRGYVSGLPIIPSLGVKGEF